MKRLLLVAIALANYAGASANIIYVNDDAAGKNDGSNWIDAYTNLQAALRAARAGDQIWVAEGVYRPTEDDRRRTSFELVSGVAMYGGFCGDERVLDERDPKMRPTVLSGGIGDSSRRTDNSVHIVESVNTDDRTSLDGFVLSGAYNSLSEFEGRGGRFMLKRAG